MNQVKHPHALPQQGGSHLLGADGKLERREWTRHVGEESPATPEAEPEHTAPSPPARTHRKEK